MKTQQPIPIRDNAGTLGGDIAPVMAYIPGIIAPGSQAAYALGCTCPVRSNWMGDGAEPKKWGMRQTIDYPPKRVWLIDRAGRRA